MFNRTLAPSSMSCPSRLGMPCFALAYKRDVVIIFHAHCLSPYRFYSDMNRLGLWVTGMAFPLERLYSLIVTDTWSDAASEQAWNSGGKAAPYQLWHTDPAAGGELQLQDVAMNCPLCHHIEHFPLTEFTATHTTKSAFCQCGSCGQRFNADTLSAKDFRDDLLEFIKVQNGW